MNLDEMIAKINFMILGIIIIFIPQFVYSQSNNVPYGILYDQFNPVALEYNPHFKYSLDKENQKMLWYDDNFNLTDEHGNEFNSKFLIDAATYKKGYLLIILQLEFKSKISANRYYNESLNLKEGNTQVKLIGDGYKVAIINAKYLE